MKPQPRKINVPRAPRWSRSGAGLEITVYTIVVVAVVVDAITVAGEGFPAGGVLAFVATAAGVGLSYRAPHIGLVLVAASSLVGASMGWTPTANWSIACFVAFLLSLRGLSGLLSGLVIAAANFAAVWLAEGTLDVAINPAASISAFAALAAAAVGTAIRESRRYWRQLEERTRDAVASREAAVDRSVAQERLRIARDLHDSVGHEIAVVNMHLGAAEVHLDSDSAAARAQLESAQRGVQSVLRETQQILRVLRVGSDADLAPTPVHGRVPELIDSLRSAGLAIEATIEDLAHPLAPNVSAAVYRITQEALTNAQRHGTGAVSLRLAVADDGAVTIEVVNMVAPGVVPAGGTSLSGGGNGLVGMRERAASVGGNVRVHRDDRFYWLTAHLPAEGASAT